MNYWQRKWRRGLDLATIMGMEILYAIRLLSRRIWGRSRERYIRHHAKSFQGLIRDWKSRQYEKMIILGTGRGLNQVTADVAQKLNQMTSALTVGLNRAYLRYEPEILLWVDYETLGSMGHHIFQRKTTVVQVQKSYPYRKYYDDWLEDRNLRNFRGKGLIFLRSVLTSAFHLSFILNIRHIDLVGVDFDSRAYFYEGHPHYDPSSEYEMADRDFIETSARGYTTHRAVQEMLEYLTLKEGYRIRYTDESQFLSSLKGLEKIDISSV